MKIRFLGTGTSTGVPQLGCRCATCVSRDARDRRMRTSAIVTNDADKNILIDCGPDFYHQMLAAGSPGLEALLITHSHYDHVGGIDDLRPYCVEHAFPVFCQAGVEVDLRARVPYCFAAHPYPGVPTFDITQLQPLMAVEIGGSKVLPLPIMHYKLEILGFKIDRLGYVTDCKNMPQVTKDALHGIDTLVINALRFETHMSHITLGEALNLIQEISPRQAFLTHLSHQIGCHEELQKLLPSGVYAAYDGLEITF